MDSAGSFLPGDRSKTWWRHQTRTFSALLALCVGNSPVNGEFPSRRPVTRSFDVFFDLRQNIRFNKQSRHRWFKTPSRSLWRHCNDKETWIQILVTVQGLSFFGCVLVKSHQIILCSGTVEFLLLMSLECYNSLNLESNFSSCGFPFIKENICRTSTTKQQTRKYVHVPSKLVLACV